MNWAFTADTQFANATLLQYQNSALKVQLVVGTDTDKSCVALTAEGKTVIQGVSSHTVDTGIVNDDTRSWMVFPVYIPTICAAFCRQLNALTSQKIREMTYNDLVLLFIEAKHDTSV